MTDDRQGFKAGYEQAKHMQQVAREYVAQQMEQRVAAVADSIPPGEKPIATSAGDLARLNPEFPEGATVEEITRSVPTSDGDFVLTNKTLIYRDPRGEVWPIPLRSITSWRQKRSTIHPRVREVEIHVRDGDRYMMEVGKRFARQVRKAGRIRRGWLPQAT